jgi:hypothetical protein
MRQAPSLSPRLTVSLPELVKYFKWFTFKGHYLLLIVDLRFLIVDFKSSIANHQSSIFDLQYSILNPSALLSPDLLIFCPLPYALSSVISAQAGI